MAIYRTTSLKSLRISDYNSYKNDKSIFGTFSIHKKGYSNQVSHN